MKRDALFGQIPFFWPDLNDEEYALYDCLTMSTDAVRQIRAATRDVRCDFPKDEPAVANAPR